MWMTSNYIRKLDQPPVADYIHRICKDTRAFLKVATIRHRSGVVPPTAMLLGE